MVALDEALKELADIDPQQSQIVEMRFFGGMSIEETAEVLNLSPATIKREWNAAKAWLYRELSKAQEEAARKAILRQILSEEARQRLTRLAMARPEVALAMADQFLRLAAESGLSDEGRAAAGLC